MKLCGIDNGLSGSLALLNTTTNEVLIEDTQLRPDRTLDCDWVLSLLSEWAPDHAIIEYCHNNNPLVEMGGMFICICDLLGIPIQKVAVNRWKKMLLGISTKNKKVSIAKCLELFPMAPLNRPTPVLKKPTVNDDRAEALLLAHYLRLTLSPKSSGG